MICHVNQNHIKSNYAIPSKVSGKSVHAVSRQNRAQYDGQEAKLVDAKTMKSKSLDNATRCIGESRKT